MILIGIIVGLFLGYAIRSRIKDPDYFTKDDFIFAIIFGIFIGFIGVGYISVMAPLFAPTTDYDYSFNIYSADPNSKVFVLEENEDTYTYKRKTADGFKSESIPINISHINYSNDGTAKVFADAEKRYNTDEWGKHNLLFFEDRWEPKIYVDKYIITIPEGSIVR